MTATEEHGALTPYEQRILAELRSWRTESPSLIARGVAQVSNPATRAMQNFVPSAAIHAALEASNAVAARFARREAILKVAGAAELSELRQADLARCDQLVERVLLQATGIAAGSGALTGFAGLAGMIADVPALLTLSLHTIHRAGLCYGYDTLGAAERPYAVGVFALASANTMDEKQDALRALDEAGDQPDIAAWRDGLERAAQRELSKSAAVLGLHNLARQLGINLGRRKAATAVPVLGAVVGGIVNAWYLRDLGTAARHAFQSRRLRERGVVVL